MCVDGRAVRGADPREAERRRPGRARGHLVATSVEEVRGLVMRVPRPGGPIG
jgi:hypothetical protein